MSGREMGAPLRPAVLAASLGLIATAPLLFRLYRPAGDGLDVTGHPIGRDFINVWAGSRLAFDGQIAALFDIAAYAESIGRLFGQPLPFHVWSYPPQTLLLIAPFGALPYFPALALWTLGLFAAFAGVTLSVVAPEARPRALALLALAPACLINTAGGQNGFLTGSLLLGGLLWLDRRPVLAGFLFGLLSFKPQLGVALPFVLIALGAWRALLSACIAALLLVAASLALFGIEPWQAYLTTTRAYQWLVIERFEGFYPVMMTSVYAGARTVGLPLQASLVLQACIALPVLAATVWAVRRTVDPRQRAAIVVCAVPLLTPYTFNYDLTGLAAVAVWRLCDREPEAASPWLLAAWLIPAVTIPVNMVGLGIAPVLLLALFLLQLRRIATHWPAVLGGPAAAVVSGHI